MTLPTYADLVRRFGLAFSPDRGGAEYAGHPASYESTLDVELHDGVVRAAFAEFETNPDAHDPYFRTLVVWREDGLIVAGDPGPPDFRAAYEAYVSAAAALNDDISPAMPDDTLALQRIALLPESATAEQMRAMAMVALRWSDVPDDAIDTSDIPEATESFWQRARLTYPRPRIGLSELLDEVQEFQRATHPARMNVRALGWEGAEREFAVQQTRLRDWFAERGIDVDPEG